MNLFTRDTVTALAVAFAGHPDLLLESLREQNARGLSMAIDERPCLPQVLPRKAMPGLLALTNNTK